jgi:glucosamine 6-phosphate synthetase-like amidotransferase/phosphosugar isomerase protein
VVVHNGIIENHRELKQLLSAEAGFVFRTETDSEVVAALALYVWNMDEGIGFRELVEQVVVHLVSLVTF